MGTLEDQLRRREWDPTPGDELIGAIVGIDEGSFQRKDGTTYWYPILVIRDDTDTEWEVRCTRGGLFNPVVAKQPKIGDRVGIRYDGTVETSYGEAHRYRVAFDDDDKPKQLDWSRMTNQDKDKDRSNDTTDSSSTTDATAWPAASTSDDPETTELF